MITRGAYRYCPLNTAVYKKRNFNRPKPTRRTGGGDSRRSFYAALPGAAGRVTQRASKTDGRTDGLPDGHYAKSTQESGLDGAFWGVTDSPKTAPYYCGKGSARGRFLAERYACVVGQRRGRVQSCLGDTRLKAERGA